MATPPTPKRGLWRKKKGKGDVYSSREASFLSRGEVKTLKKGRTVATPRTPKSGKEVVVGGGRERVFIPSGGVEPSKSGEKS